MISVDRYWALTRPLDYGVKHESPVGCVSASPLSKSRPPASPCRRLSTITSRKERAVPSVPRAQLPNLRYSQLLLLSIVRHGGRLLSDLPGGQADRRRRKKSQSHLLMTSNAAASSLTAGSRSSRCNSALVIRCHGDWQNHPEQMRSSIDSNCSS